MSSYGIMSRVSDKENSPASDPVGEQIGMRKRISPALEESDPALAAALRRLGWGPTEWAARTNAAGGTQYGRTHAAKWYRADRYKTPAVARAVALLSDPGPEADELYLAKSRENATGEVDEDACKAARVSPVHVRSLSGRLARILNECANMGLAVRSPPRAGNGMVITFREMERLER